MIDYTATYSPEDNKLRLYASARLPADVYEKVRAAGFVWAPKQELFVAPAWTPEREDLLIELAGEIADEDTTLVERAAGRADRFEEYGEKREADAHTARAAVAEIAEGIPLGQPILVGHHSERRARRDAERIESGMRKAVRMWETSQYWVARAAGAVRHARYKQLPAVRARRIKALEAERRKVEKTRADHEKLLRFWSQLEIPLAEALRVANYFDRLGVRLPDGERDWSAWSALTDGRITVEEVRRQRAEGLPPIVEGYARWVSHLDNRLAYERAMLGESGGIATDKVRPETGGACRCWASPGHGKGWSVIQKVNKVTVTLLDNWGNGGKDFTRTVPFDQLKDVMSQAEVEAKRAEGLLHVIAANNGSAQAYGFYLHDEPVKPAPNEPRPAVDEAAATFAALRETLRAGVTVVTAPQLFPTPPDVARRLVELAEVRPVHSVLEPSAGTGAILSALPVGADVTAVEVVPALAEQLQHLFPNAEVRTGDFLELDGLGEFDRIVMNPPFARGSDIAHIAHAFAHLAEGGRLVAVCANGPRQREELGEVCSRWIDLPPGTFKDQGTNVNTAIVVIDN